MLFVGPTTSAVRARNNGAKNAPESRMRTGRFMPRSTGDIQSIHGELERVVRFLCCVFTNQLLLHLHKYYLSLTHAFFQINQRFRCFTGRMITAERRVKNSYITNSLK